jgi:hypothetical protein
MSFYIIITEAKNKQVFHHTIKLFPICCFVSVAEINNKPIANHSPNQNQFSWLIPVRRYKQELKPINGIRERF